MKAEKHTLFHVINSSYVSELTRLDMTQNFFLKIRNIKFNANPLNSFRDVTFAQMDGLTDILIRGSQQCERV